MGVVGVDIVVVPHDALIRHHAQVLSEAGLNVRAVYTLSKVFMCSA
jgi:hypothetical protein